ncbi:unnamed protein product [Cylicocyclus nassatus]|uniref:Uncharacterized protein n=1 Tax=Cylicocyclus nassatus TaxID=53992 RepID=A0AA36MEM7_CYLNA|nr:unnamed protein product [Cylicocyclus nassatus]
MRHFVWMLLLLLILEVAVEARKPFSCYDMFVRPKLANKRCNTACWKYNKCRGRCEFKHGRKRCSCGRVCGRIRSFWKDRH